MRSLTAPVAVLPLLVLVLAGCTGETPQAAAPAPSSPSPDSVVGRPISALPTLPKGDMSVRWQVMEQDPTSRQVTVTADTGCERNPPVQVAETAESVTIRVVIPSQLDPFFCVGEPQAHTVTLAEPLGDRRLVPAPLEAG